MDEKKLKALAAQLAKGLKNESDLNQFSRMLTKLTVENQAPTEDAALMALDAFAKVWDDKYPQISKSWRAHWENLNNQ